MSEQPRNSSDSLQFAIAAFLDQKTKADKAKNRRWMIFTAFAVLYFSVGLIQQIIDSDLIGASKPYAAVVRVDGQISTGKRASTDALGDALEKAFKDKGATCVALVINSPGGMVAQSQLIHDEVKKLAKLHNKKVIAVGEDYMASGGYLIASSAERIYAPTTGIVGSVGVIISGYDLTGLGEKYGVKDRTYTAGGLKDPLNPLVTPTEEAKAKIHEVLDELHGEFIRMVKESRGDRIKAEDSAIFTGEFWTGLGAARLGLTDGFLDLEAAVSQDCGADRVKLFEPRFGLASLIPSLF